MVIGGDYITTESGTGLVHTAPGHGQEDYQVKGGGRVFWRGGRGGGGEDGAFRGTAGENRDILHSMQKWKG